MLRSVRKARKARRQRRCPMSSSPRWAVLSRRPCTAAMDKGDQLYLPGVHLIVTKPWIETRLIVGAWTKILRARRPRHDVTRDAQNNKWPSKLQYVFDETNPKASRTITLGPYTTMRSRLIHVENITPGKASWPAEWCYNWRKQGFSVFHIVDLWVDKIGLTMSDGGQLTRPSFIGCCVDSTLRPTGT
jgi:hypothetical protein